MTAKDKENQAPMKRLMVPFLIGAVIAAVVELAPVPIDDNLTIPLISGGFMNLVLIWA